MSRYITASKLGQLVLLGIYVRGKVPNDALIAVLAFVSARIHHYSATATNGASPPVYRSAPATMDDFLAMMKPFDSLPGRTLHALFLDALWAIKTLEDLHDFFREMVDFFKKPYEPSEDEDGETGEEVDSMYLLDGLSPVGMFVRRTYLEFVRLQFDDTAKLWVSFVKFRQPTDGKWQKLPDLRRLDPTFAELGVQGDSIMPSIVYGRVLDQLRDEQDLSTHEIDRVLEFQLEKLQSTSIGLSDRSLTPEGYGDRLPDAVREECQSMLQKAAAVPTVIHFIKYAAPRAMYQANSQILRRVEGRKLYHGLRVLAPLL
jgi:anaphase-promoting complex subunit 5